LKEVPSKGPKLCKAPLRCSRPKLFENHVLTLLDFDEVFKEQCDAHGVGIGAVLI